MTGRIPPGFDASTPIRPEGAEAMRPFLGGHHGNPSSLHRAGLPAKDAAERARAQVAGLRGIFGDEVTLIGRPTGRMPDTLDVNVVGRVGAEVPATLPGVAA